MIEVVTASNSVSLPTNQIVEGRTITSIGMRKAAAGQKSRYGKTLAASGVIATAHLRLADAGGGTIAEIPLNMLERDANSPEHLRVNWQGVQPSQSSIVLDTAASGYDATHVIELVFGYDCGQQCK